MTSCTNTFQSTRPRGARRDVNKRYSWPSSFNPRAHVGRDRSRCDNRHAIACFNPRAHVGRDLTGIEILKDSLCFNPRAHVGRDVVGND